MIRRRRPLGQPARSSTRPQEQSPILQAGLVGRRDSLMEEHGDMQLTPIAPRPPNHHLSMNPAKRPQQPPITAAHAEHVLRIRRFLAEILRRVLREHTLTQYQKHSRAAWALNKVHDHTSTRQRPDSTRHLNLSEQQLHESRGPTPSATGRLLRPRS